MVFFFFQTTFYRICTRGKIVLRIRIHPVLFHFIILLLPIRVLRVLRVNKQNVAKKNTETYTHRIHF